MALREQKDDFMCRLHLSMANKSRNLNFIPYILYINYYILYILYISYCLNQIKSLKFKFLPDVKLIFSTPVIRMDKSNANGKNKQFTNCLKKAKFDCISYEHHKGSFKCLWSPYKWVRYKGFSEESYIRCSCNLT